MTESTELSIENGAQQDQILRYYKEQCHGAESNVAVRNASGLFCPALWDNVTCWPATRAGEAALQPCPHYVVGLDPQANASKQCTEDGRWYVHPELQTHWANFSSCVHGPTATVVVGFHGTPNVSYIEGYFPYMKVISKLGFSLSLVTLLIALFVLATNKRLRCPRNVVHMHLFVSFILRAFVVLLKDSIYLNGVGLASNYVKDKVFINNSMCKFGTTVWHYCIMANYSWILMEGLYLHNLIFLALFTDSSSITLYIILGWGLPILFLLPWVGVRIWLDDHLCWITNDTAPYISLMIEVPITLSVMINTAFFVNIVRVLLHKIKATFMEKPQTFRKWAKSTLVLVPLFGVHYIVFLGMTWVPTTHVNPVAEAVWLFSDQTFSAFQGFVVAILYFFLNGEVKYEVNKKWQSIRRRKSRCRNLSVHGTYCTTASSASLNSLKWGNSRVSQPAQTTNDKKVSPFYPQLTETTRLNSFGNLNAVNCEENDWRQPSGNTNNIELGCLIP
ncbi:secretin receptor-like [Bacillus rossius redtenbacheri]|uniref:secretin receptor-like n=1 Tax=Bacillus rossius redtenbacheri TaxID=93214 RepID=UPI002FDE35BD